MVAALLLFDGLNLVPGTLWILQSFMWDMEGQGSGSTLGGGDPRSVLGRRNSSHFGPARHDVSS
jgi:hypothetical protein